MKAELDGIGASLQYDDGNTIVNELVDGGAAQLDGQLKPKDRVIGVGQGENGEIVDVVDMSLNDVVKLIRGKAGTIVRLKVIPVGQDRAENLQHHPGQNRVEELRSPIGNSRSRQEARRPAVQDRLHRSARASTWIWKAPARAWPTSKAARAMFARSSTTSTKSTSTR